MPSVTCCPLWCWQCALSAGDCWRHLQQVHWKVIVVSKGLIRLPAVRQVLLEVMVDFQCMDLPRDGHISHTNQWQQQGKATQDRRKALQHNTLFSNVPLNVSLPILACCGVERLP